MLLAWMSPFVMIEAASNRSTQVEAAALAESVSKTRPFIRAVAAAVLKESPTSADVEDCVQETLRRALEGSSELRSPSALRSWVTGIARHVALDLIRARQAVRARTQAPPASPDDTGERFLAVPDPKPDAERALMTRMQMLALEEALDALPEGQRDALSLFFLEDKSYQEISAALGVPIGTVATWVARGRSRVIARIEQRGKEQR